MICANCQQTEGVVHRIGGDGLCEECRIALARAQVASTRRCVSCLEPEETDEGVIVLDDSGVCEDCQDRRFQAQEYAKECCQSMDFDYSMNY